MSTQSIFDAIVGYDGSAAVGGWEGMSRDDLIAEAEAQGEHYEGSISIADAERVADAALAYKCADNADDAYRVRASLA